MGYGGLIVPVQPAGVGLNTDLAQVVLTPQPTAVVQFVAPRAIPLIYATNVSLRYGNVEKDPGSQRWSNSPLPEGIVGLSEWLPTDEVQRVFAACRDGNLYRFTSGYQSKVVPSDGSAPATNNYTDQMFFVPGGAEDVGRNRKLFIISGNDPIQVIDGDATKRRALNLPAADWSSMNSSGVTTYYNPQGGVIFNQRFCVWGNKNNPHMIYMSNATDHEDFQTTPNGYLLVPVFPGEGDRISCAIVWKGRLMIMKYPFGLYYIDDSNPTAPVPVKLSGSFGAASPHAAIQMLDDILVGNSTSSISSLKAVFSLGETEQGDVLKQLGCVKQVQNNSSSAAVGVRQAIYYENKKQALFIYRSSSGQFNDRILCIDHHDSTPKVTWIDKDQPNCIALIRNLKLVPTPMYGSEDGYIYQMDSPIRSVGTYTPLSAEQPLETGYEGAFQTPYLDFSWVDPKLADRDKVFDHIGLTFVPQGNWNLSADIWVDDRFVQTVQFNMGRKQHMSGNWPLDFTNLMGPSIISREQKIQAFGRRISVRFYNSVSGQNFKIQEIQFYFRPAGTKNR